MTTYTDTQHRSILVQDTGAIEVRTVTRVWAMNGEQREEVSSKAGDPELLQPGADLTGQPVDVLAIAAAIWTPEQVRAGTDALLALLAEREAVLQEAHDKAVRDEAARAADLQRKQQDNDATQAGLERSSAALAAAHRELDAEHATLAERSEKITADRADLFAQADAIRTKRPQLAALVDDIIAEPAADGRPIG